MEKARRALKHRQATQKLLTREDFMAAILRTNLKRVQAYHFLSSFGNRVLLRPWLAPWPTYRSIRLSATLSPSYPLVPLSPYPLPRDKYFVCYCFINLLEYHTLLIFLPSSYTGSSTRYTPLRCWLLTPRHGTKSEGSQVPERRRGEPVSIARSQCTPSLDIDTAPRGGVFESAWSQSRRGHGGSPRSGEVGRGQSSTAPGGPSRSFRGST